MRSAYCEGTGIRTIIQSLPANQIKHMSQVGASVGLIARKISEYGIYTERISADAYKYFGNAAFYHDIGKVWVPPEILSKPGKLMADEISMVRNHTVYAIELFVIIRNGWITGVPEHLIPLAYDSAVYHHEWWDGTGYPFGMSYEDIPLIARVTSICDAYDAITSDRAYRSAHSHDYACREIEKNAGIQFDPTLAKIFLNHEAEIANLFKKQ